MSVGEDGRKRRLACAGSVAKLAGIGEAGGDRRCLLTLWRGLFVSDTREMRGGLRASNGWCIDNVGVSSKMFSGRMDYLSRR